MPEAPTDPPRGRGGPFRFAMTCGCVFLVIGAVLLGLMSWQAKRSMSMDPEKVVAAADRILPGARPLQGQVGLFSVDFAGTRMVFLGDPRQGGGAPRTASPGASEVVTTTLMSREASDLTPRQLVERLRRELEARRYWERGARILRQEEVRFRLHGKDLPAAHLLVETEQRRRFEEFTLVLPGPEGGQVIAMFMGPEKSLDPTHVQAFLDGLVPQPTAPAR